MSASLGHGISIVIVGMQCWYCWDMISASLGSDVDIIGTQCQYRQHAMLASSGYDVSNYTWYAPPLPLDMPSTCCSQSACVTLSSPPTGNTIFCTAFASTASTLPLILLLLLLCCHPMCAAGMMMASMLMQKTLCLDIYREKV